MARGKALSGEDDIERWVCADADTARIEFKAKTRFRAADHQQKSGTHGSNYENDTFCESA